MKHSSYDSHPACPIEAITDLIGGKWTGIIIYHLIDGVKRYSYLQKNSPNITARMLTKQLKKLEESGLVIRTSYPTIPPTVEYKLSEFGQEFIPLFKSMHKLGTNFLNRHTLKT